MNEHNELNGTVPASDCAALCLAWGVDAEAVSDLCDDVEAVAEAIEARRRAKIF